MNVIIIIGVLIASIIGEYFLRRKLKVSKTEKMSPRANRFKNIAIAILIASYLVVFLIYEVDILGKYKIDVEFRMLFFVLPFFYLVTLLRTFMEWKYNRPAKQWAMEIYSIFVWTMILIVMQVSWNLF